MSTYDVLAKHYVPRMVALESILGVGNVTIWTDPTTVQESASGATQPYAIGTEIDSVGGLREGHPLSEMRGQLLGHLHMDICNIKLLAMGGATYVEHSQPLSAST
jgi:hypothetical protein